MSGLIKAKDGTLYKFLNEKYEDGKKVDQVFEIPCYQRNYSWDKKECETLFNDIYYAYKNTSSYYLGSLIYYKQSHLLNKNAYFLLDGQQRITSIIVLLCALRDIYPESEIKDDIQNSFISNDGDINKLKIKQNQNDEDIFEKIARGEIKEVRNKQSKIYKAYNTFSSCIKSKNINNLQKFVETIKNISIVRIQVYSKKPQIIQTLFEKINSTGKSLTQSDLIRNYLLISKNDDDQKEPYKLWSYLEKIIPMKNMDAYLKSYVILNLRNDTRVVNNNEIYNRFVEIMRKKEKKSILKDLIKYALIYELIDENKLYVKDDDGNYIIDPDQNKNERKYNVIKKLRPIFILLRNMGTSELYPFFMYLYDFYYNKSNFSDLEEILDLILDFIIRYRTTGTSKGGGALSTAIRKLMNEINKKPANAKKKYIHEYLSKYELEGDNFYPTNKQFKEAIMNTIDTNNAKVLLYQLERKKDVKGIEVDFNTITLEHILPQTTSDRTEYGKWWIKKYGGLEKITEIKKDYLWCIGNLVILSDGKNKGNSPWTDKKRIYRTDKFNYTREAAAYNTWLKKDIEDRNNNFSDEICKYITGPMK